jgi:predicted transposase YbfD/YdcC
MIPLAWSLPVWIQSRGAACFFSWVQAITTVLPAQQIAIDGKTARRSHDRGAGKAAIQTVSAWATQTHLVLAQRHVKEHSNEQTALPRLLGQLELAGYIVSIDAMGCLPKIAKQIKAQDGEYVLALKANQGTMYQDVVDLFDDALTTGFAELVHDTHHSVDKGHGRLEDRQYWTIADQACLAYLNAKQTWTGLRSIGVVEATRTVGEQVSTERRYYLTSLPGEARAFDAAVRSHWGGSKMASTGCSTSRFRKMPVACARTTVSRTLSSYDIWRSTSSNRSRRPSVASKPGGSKLDGVKITFAKSSLPNNLDAIALGKNLFSLDKNNWHRLPNHNWQNRIASPTSNPELCSGGRSLVLLVVHRAETSNGIDPGNHFHLPVLLSGLRAG